MKRISILLLLLFSLSSYAQDRYMVFFKDKNNSPYSVNQPEQYLSAKAIERRERQQIPITTEDLPVNSNYINTLESLGVETFFTTKWMNGVLVQMDEAQEALVSALDFVASTEWVASGNPLRSVRSEKFGVQLSTVDNLAQEQYGHLGIDVMHEYGIEGEGISIAIMDDGFQNYSQLPAFESVLNEDRLLLTYDFVGNRESVENGNNHGTRVFSILGADQENYRGAAPLAAFMLFVTEANQEYRIEEYNWLFAIEMADSAGVDLVNTSLGYRTGFTDPSMNYTDAQLNGETAVITRAANIAASKGIVLVNSAGNSGSNALVSAPADSPFVIAVGAVNFEGEIASFSSRNSSTPNRFKPDVVALGVGTLLVTAEGTLVSQNGTSFSSPLVAGLVAGVMQAYPNKTAEEITEMIRLSGDQAGTPDNTFGYGVPNFERIVARERVGISENPQVYNAFPNPTNDDIQLNFEEAYFGEKLTIEVISSKGELKSREEYVPFEGKNPLKISLEESGLYFLRVVTSSHTATRKIIKY